jgi:hypothetical protein
MKLSYKTQNLSLQETIVDLLCQVDTKLSNEAKKKLDNDRFGASVCVDISNSEMLTRYKQILIDKANNSLCLYEFSVDDIISRIKELLNSD